MVRSDTRWVVGIRERRYLLKDNDIVDYDDLSEYTVVKHKSEQLDLGQLNLATLGVRWISGGAHTFLLLFRLSRRPFARARLKGATGWLGSKVKPRHHPLKENYRHKAYGR